MKNYKFKAGVYFFYFHDISNDSRVPQGIRCSLDKFERTVRFIDHNFHLVTFADALSITRDQINCFTTTQRYACLSFDDGFKSILDTVDILDSRKIIPTVFLNSKFVFDRDVPEVIVGANLKPSDIQRIFPNIKDRTLAQYLKDSSSMRNYLSLNKLAERQTLTSLFLTETDASQLAGAGWRIGNHGSHHLNMGCLARDEQFAQIVDSHKSLKKLPNYDGIYALPYGHSLSYNSHTCELMKELNSSNLITASGSIRHRYHNECYLIERIGISDSKPPIETLIEQRLNSSFKFKLKMNSLARRFIELTTNFCR